MPTNTPITRNTRKNWIVLVVALALGGLAAYVASNYLAERMAEIDARATDIDKVQVVVAKISLPAGASITPDTVAVREIPRLWAHSGAITPDQFSRAESLALAYPAAVGEAILWAQLEGRRAPTFSARLQSSSPQAGMGFELDAIGACFIGGASAYGGIGTVGGTLIGALIMGVLNNGMSIMGISIDWQQAIKGFVLLMAVAFDVLGKKKK